MRPRTRRATVLTALAAALLSGTAPAGASADPPGPAVPAAPWASSLGTTITVSWQQPRTGPAARSFHVREGDRVVARTSTTSAQLEVPFGTSHTYTVTAVDRRGRESAPSAPVTGRSWLSGYNPECMPSSVPLTVTAVSATALSVAWTPHPLGGDLELRVDGQSLGFTSVTGARVGGLAPATTHQVVLYRYNRCGSGSLTPVASTTATTAPGEPVTLPPPSGLTVAGRTDSTVALSWAAPAGPPPDRYAVYDAGTLVAVTTATAARVDRLYPATAHRFTVAALDAAGNESAHSTPVSAATQTCLAVPPQPVALTATALSASSVRLGWTLEAAADSYTVYDGGTAVATSRYPDVVLSGLPSGSTHAYRVSATLPQGCGETPRSTRATVVTPAGPAHRPDAPATLSVTGNTPTGASSTQLTLTWSASAGADRAVGYRVYEGATVVGETAGTTLSFTVGAATTHAYTVVAVNAAGHESAASPAVTVRAMYMPPP